MTNTFITMVNRIATELRRSNLTAEIKNAINDAIWSESNQRFYFNEVRGEADTTFSFATVAGTEFYPDLGFVEVDAMYYYIGQTRYNILPWSKLEADRIARGGPIVTSQPVLYSRSAGKFRIFPKPNVVVTIYVDGFGSLVPTPLVNDNDTNAWMNEAEPLIRAVAKSILLKDVIRDYGEATATDAIAADYRTSLLGQTTLVQGTGEMRPTQW